MAIFHAEACGTSWELGPKTSGLNMCVLAVKRLRPGDLWCAANYESILPVSMWGKRSNDPRGGVFTSLGPGPRFRR